MLTILVFRNHFKVRQMTHNNLEISLEDNPSKQKKATKQEPDLKLDLKSDSDAVEPEIEIEIEAKEEFATVNNP